MNTLTAILEVILYVLKMGVAAVLVVMFAWIGTMVYDEVKFHTKLAFTMKKVKKAKYVARHRLAEKFIDDLVVEMRQDPNSLCYEDPFSEDAVTEALARGYALAA